MREDSGYDTFFENGDIVVYYTPSGEKYHKYDCDYLNDARESKDIRAVELYEVEEYNLQPCNVCKPPQYGVNEEAPYNLLKAWVGLFIIIGIIYFYMNNKKKKDT